MDAVTFESTAFRDGRFADAMDIYLHTLYSLDCSYLRRFPNTPRLYQSGVRYQAEQQSAERWLEIPRVLARGHGDCEDLASWRAAELTVFEGIEAHPAWNRRNHVLASGDEIIMFHILTVRNDRIAEDPSYILGMRPAWHSQNLSVWRM